MEAAIVERTVAEILAKKLRPIVKINRGMLAEKVRGLNGSDIYTLYTRTKPKLLKKDRVTKEPCLFDEVVKVSVVNGFVGVDYESCVNRQRDREDKPVDFEAKERAWGTHAGGSLLTHTPKGETIERKYIAFKPQNHLSTHYEDIKGNEIPKEQLVNFLPVPSPSRQKVEKEVVWRTYKVDSIVSLAANNLIWQIID